MNHVQKIHKICDWIIQHGSKYSFAQILVQKQICWFRKVLNNHEDIWEYSDPKHKQGVFQYSNKENKEAKEEN